MYFRVEDYIPASLIGRMTALRAQAEVSRIHRLSSASPGEEAELQFLKVRSQCFKKVQGSRDRQSAQSLWESSPSGHMRRPRERFWFLQERGFVTVRGRLGGAGSVGNGPKDGTSRLG